MSWIYFNSVTIANGSKVVSVNSGEDITNVNVGDALIVNNLAPVEIYRAYIDGSNNKFIELVNAWDGATQTTQNADIFPTAGSFITATEKLRNATAITEGNFKTLEEWGTQMGTTTFTGYDNTENTARTLLQMDADAQSAVDDLNAVSGSVNAMTKAEFFALAEKRIRDNAGSGHNYLGGVTDV